MHSIETAEKAEYCKENPVGLQSFAKVMR